MLEKEVLLVVSKVKAAVAATEMRSGESFLTALNEHVHKMVAVAAENAKKAGRKTLSSEDI